MKCNVCNEELEIKPDNIHDHNQVYLLAVALIQQDEGSFIGYSLKPINTTEEFEKYSDLPLMQIPGPGILNIEWAYQYFRNKGQLDFLVCFYIKED
jgi:hypothetical protein